MSLLALLAAATEPVGQPGDVPDASPHVRKPALADYTPTAALTVPSPAADDVYHPDVIDTVTGWNGYRYWMGFTPFPSEADENPCIVASHDGSTWVVPPGLTNPIDPAPNTYNSDTDLVMPGDGLLYCFYREGGGGLLRYRTSGTGSSWSPEVVIGTIGHAGTLSPAFVKVGATWRMWYIADTDGTLWTVSAASPTGPWSTRAACSMEVPTGYKAWHVDVIRHDGRYYGLVYCHQGPGPENIVVGITSGDGITWGQSTDVLMQPNSTFSQMYRATLQPADGGFDVWIGATRRTLNGRRLGRTFIPIAEFQ